MRSSRAAHDRPLAGAPALPTWLTGSERALAERGEYLATVAPCGMCHTPATAFTGFLTSHTLAGGMEARWRLFGSAVSSNLTPHRDGIAAASVPALSRALRSGIGTDGRALHWQAMPWDIFSHWSEEDRLAIIAYLRALPPVDGRVPPPRRHARAIRSRLFSSVTPPTVGVSGARLAVVLMGAVPDFVRQAI